MSEFETAPTESAPVAPSPPPPVRKKQSILTRPLFLGQSLPWLVGGGAVIVFAAWFLFWPSPSPDDASQLAFGQSSGLQPVTASGPAPLQTGGLSVPEGMQGSGNVPEDVVKLIREGREFEAANREAISRLSDTVRAQSAALAALQGRMDGLAAENSRMANRVTVLEARQTAAPSVHTSGTKTARRSALSGMRLEGVQDGMAWVNWQNRTWAVQAGERLGSIIVLDVNVADRSVMTSAGELR
ncbi:conjugal transfer protein TraP [Enterobacter mori]|uniref:conjugal transfer protein TraP n=1 Tax=Enterobacter mori TaxID=539813 RepID=UPI003B84145A